MEIEHSSITVKIQWGKQKLEYELDTRDDMATFRAKLYSITFVPEEKQKIIFGGKTLKDDTVLADLKKLKPGAIFMLMGTAEGKGLNLVQAGPKKKFVEDMTEQEKQEYYKDVLGEILPIGINNLGNTCYLNSTLQVFRKIKELKHAIMDVKHTAEPLATEMKELFLQLESSGSAVSPFNFLQVFMGKFPQFAEQAQGGGGYQQQDADECFVGLLQSQDSDLSEGGKSKFDDLFGFNIRSEFKNSEDPEEEPTHISEAYKKLACVIDNMNNPVNTLTEGIEAGLVADVEKMSQNQGRNCVYSKTGKIETLPKYLIVQKLRFIWKAADTAAQTGAGKAKILRNVMFPKLLELEPFCTDELKENLQPGKKHQNNKRATRNLKDTEKYEAWKKDREWTANDTEQGMWKKFKETLKEQELEAHEKVLWRESSDAHMDTGDYELVGVITHQGRSSESGHYVGWVQDKGDKWLKYDDDYVTSQDVQKILDLRGGGDWPMAYYLVYKKTQISADDE